MGWVLNRRGFGFRVWLEQAVGPRLACGICGSMFAKTPARNLQLLLALLLIFLGECYVEENFNSFGLWLEHAPDLIVSV
jgi:hypothetical protein